MGASPLLLAARSRRPEPPRKHISTAGSCSAFARGTRQGTATPSTHTIVRIFFPSSVRTEPNLRQERTRSHSHMLRSILCVSLSACALAIPVFEARADISTSTKLVNGQPRCPLVSGLPNAQLNTRILAYAAHGVQTRLRSQRSTAKAGAGLLATTNSSQARAPFAQLAVLHLWLDTARPARAHK
jgi:hypothetical protein